MTFGTTEGKQWVEAYVLSGAIEVNGRRLGSNEVVFIPRGARYRARVLTEEGARVLRVELPNAVGRSEGAEYTARVWQGPLTDKGVPHLAEEDCRKGF